MASKDTPSQFGDYEVDRQVARHACATWYSASAQGGKSVALAAQPESTAEETARFDEEATKLEKLGHPNLAKVLGHGVDQGHLYLVEEAIPGGVQLSSLLQQRRLSLPEALRLLKGIALGVEFAHSSGLVHQHLDPSLVVVSEDLMVIKVRGFCLGLPPQQSDLTVGTTRSAFSNLAYFAPEVASEKTDVTVQSNVYAIGVMFYEMLVGKVPRGRFGLPSQANAEIPSELDAFVLKCVEAEPRERFSSITKMLARLSAIEDHLRLGLVHELQGLRSGSRASSEGGAGGSRWVVWAAIGLLVAVAIVVAVVLTRQ
ncbi:MAG: serine/threonine-protein kinase [Thermoanaerobaculia bacterium]|nr:serine/threonine-protein kinase [Thermoanaerobaculia bacterium]